MSRTQQRFILIPFVLVAASGLAWQAFAKTASDAEDPDAAKDRLFLEAIVRIDNPAIVKNPAIRQKLDGVLDRSLKRGGGAAFVDVVRKFALKERAGDLVEIAIAQPTDSLGVSAAKLAFELGSPDAFSDALRSKDKKRASNALTVLGYTQTKPALILLSQLIADKAASTPLRTETVRAMARSRGGQLRLLRLVEMDKLPNDLTFVTTQVLFASMDPKVKERAGKHLEMPTSGDAKPLPPVSELIKRKGDPRKGVLGFTKAGCIQCHQVGDKGVNFGPNLSDIGNKLAKDGMYTAILDPSAGVEHNYEGVTVTTKDGVPLMGFIVSDTESQIAMKLPGGITMNVEKKQVASKKKMKLSLMPQGLQAALSTQELIDLVEYLVSLKVDKPSDGKADRKGK